MIQAREPERKMHRDSAKCKKFSPNLPNPGALNPTNP